MWDERSQTQKISYGIIMFVYNSGKVKNIVMGNISRVSIGLGWGREFEYLRAEWGRIQV